MPLQRVIHSVSFHNLSSLFNAGKSDSDFVTFD